MSPALEIALWLIFSSITVGGLGLAALLMWVTARAITRGLSREPRPLAPSPFSPSPFGSVTVRNSIGIVGTIWLTLLLLVPLLALALWQLAVEMERGRIGVSLLFAIIHLALIWALMRLGTRVQRKIEISGAGLVVHPVIGPSRALDWSGITRVDDVSYVGPGVSGLYLYEVDGRSATVDVWLPNWELLRLAVRERTKHATWTRRHRGWLIG